MIRAVFILTVGIAVATELYVWFASVRKCRRSVKAVWAAAVITLYAIMLGMMIGFFMPYEPSALTLKVSMWILWVFVLNGTVKLVWSVFDIPARLFRRYGYLYASVWLHRIGATLAVVAAAVLICGAGVGRSRIRVERVTLSVPDLPAAFDGTRIALFSDLHYGSSPRAAALTGALVDTILDLRPHIVVNAGDNVTIDYREWDPEALSILSRLKAPLGIYAVLGNHDMGYYIRDTALINPQRNIAAITDAQERMGWHVLRNRTIYIVQRGDSIAVTGLDYPKALAHRSHSPLAENEPLAGVYDSIPDDVFGITLSHAPQLWSDVLSTGRSALTLSGHVHSMQSKITLLGRRWSPAQYMYKLWSGLYERDGRYLYINDGIGTVMLPMRIGARPEVTLIELRK